MAANACMGFLWFTTCDKKRLGNPDNASANLIYPPSMGQFREAGV